MNKWQWISLLVMCSGCAGKAVAPAVSPAVQQDPMTPLEVMATAQDSRTMLPSLVELAGSSDAQLRGQAVLALGRIGDPAAVPLLASALKDPSAEVRARAAFGTELMCPAIAEGLRSSLGQALSVESEGPCRAALLHACGRCVCPQLPEAFLTAARDADPTLRAAALVALGLYGQAGQTVSSAALQLTGDSLLDDSDAVRLAAAFALFRTATSEAGPKLAAKLRTVAASDANPQVRYHALRALARRGLLDETALTTALSDANPNVQAGASIGLTLVPTGSCELATAALVSLANKVSAEVALVDSSLGHGLRAALETLTQCELGPQARAAAQGILQQLEQLRRPRTATAGLVLCLARAAMGVEDLRLLACDPQRPDTGKKLLAQRLAKRAPKDSAALDSLVEMIRDGEPAVAVAAVLALGGMDSDQAGAALETALLEERALIVSAALDTIAERGSDASRPVAAIAAAVQKWQAGATAHAVLLCAIAALQGAAEPQAATLLEQLAADPRPEVRRAALSAIAQTPGAKAPGALPALKPTHPFEPRELLDWQGRQASVRVATTRGDFEMSLLPHLAPGTVASFVDLAQQGYFDDTPIHRVVPGFVVQAGDPTGTGLGDPGYSLRSELTDTPYDRGVVGMALSGPDTGGSQFFITLTKQPHLDGQYTVFGRVTSGMDIADLLEEGDRILAVVVKP